MRGPGEQMELALFAAPSFAEVIRDRGIKNLAVRFNSRMKRSWRVKIHTFSAMRTLTVPAYLEEAPEKVKEALVQWALISPISKRKKNSEIALRKRAFERIIFDYVESNESAQRRRRLTSVDTFKSAGRIYELTEVFQSLNAGYFKGNLSAFVRWNKSAWRSYQTTFIDAEGKKRNLISIARAYNGARVPRFAIEGIMYHEMLHIAVPPYKSGLRNIIHGREFRRAERAFPHFKEWRAWEKHELKHVAD